MLVARSTGVDTREAAAALKGVEVGVPRDALPPLAEGEIYWADLVGLDVREPRGRALGKVRGDRLDIGAHPLLRVARRGRRRPERLIPFVAAIVDAVDVEARRIEVDWEPDY